MVHTGKPSAGCVACRKRRIKCDEKTPSCSYCLKKQITCERPKSQFDIAWKPQNVVASNAVQRRVKASLRAGRGKSDTGDMTIHSQQGVPRILPQDFEHYAISFFFNHYILASNNINAPRGFLDCVYPVWEQSSPSSPLRSAVTAASMALLEAWSRFNPDAPQTQARNHYVCGIADIRRHLQSSVIVTDDVLMATLMLDLYEGVTAFCGSRPHIGTHVTGIGALVQYRRDPSSVNEMSTKIMGGLRSLIVGRALRSGQSLSEDVLNMVTNVENATQTPESELDEIDFEISNLQAMASQPGIVIGHNPPLPNDILVKANQLDERLVSWMNDIPPQWIPICVSSTEDIPRGVRSAGLYQTSCTVHRDIFTADVLNGYCCSRIRVQLIKIACFEYSNLPNRETVGISARKTIQELADTICASVPAHLGDKVGFLRLDDRSTQYPQVGGAPTSPEYRAMAAAYTGFLLSRRLVELLRLGLVLREGQVSWILGQLQRIRNVYKTSS